MTRQINAVPNPQLLIAALTLGLFAIFGIGAVKAWAPGSAEVQEAAPAAVPDNAPPQRETSSELNAPPGKCLECGIIESKREVWTGGDGTEVTDAAELARLARDKARQAMSRSYVVTVRTRDGARHRIVDAASPNWQPGERVIVIRGRAED